MEKAVDTPYGPGEKRVRMTRLLDIYGGLLSEKQRKTMELSCDDDLSLSEIAEICGITRAGVHDRIVKSEAILEGAEARLGLIGRSDALTETAGRIAEDAETICSLSEDERVSLLAREIKKRSSDLM